MYFIYAVFLHAYISNNRVDVPKLSDDNYKLWKKRILLYLGCMHLDYVIRKDKPIITDTSTPAKRYLYDL